MSVGKGGALGVMRLYFVLVVEKYSARPAPYDVIMPLYIFLIIKRCIRDLRRKKTQKKQRPSTQTCKRVFLQKRPKNANFNKIDFSQKLPKNANFHKNGFFSKKAEKCEF